MRMPAFNGKEQKNRDFLLILWKPVLGIDDYTDFTSLMGYFLLAVWNMTIYLIVIFFFLISISSALIYCLRMRWMDFFFNGFKNGN